MNTFSGFFGSGSHDGGTSGSKPSGAQVAAPRPSAKRHTEQDITGKFDPTALERGAKALRELDHSPNATKAFDVIKLQELTRQREIAKEIEELQAARAQAQADRARVEGDERRKTVSHQQEQERVTAQYKTQLEAEAYAKKLQDQQKQNEEWLQKQHQAFLRQEEIRKANERELLEMRRRQFAEEKSMERELVRARVAEETKGRIQHTKETISERVQELKAQATERRTTIQTTLATVGGAFNALLEDKQKLAVGVGTITAIAAGVYGARTATHLAGKAIAARMGKPPLVRETSRWTIGRSMATWIPWRRQWSLNEKIVLPADLKERLTWTANSLISAKKNGAPFRHLLLYGSPGTGKTLFARTLARESGLDYAIMTGGDIGPLGKEAVNEVNKLFTWANRKSRKGLILFVDEAEAFLRQGRGSLAGGMSEETRNVLSAFLHHTGTESDKFCVILATNVKDVLDRAVTDRVDEEFEFPLPGLLERRQMLQMFFEEYILKETKSGRKILVADEVMDPKYLDKVAEVTDGFSGRQLAKLVIGWQAAVFGSGGNVLTKGVADIVLTWKTADFKSNKDVL